MRFLSIAVLVLFVGCSKDVPAPTPTNQPVPKQFQQNGQLYILCPGITPLPRAGALDGMSNAEQLEAVRYTMINVQPADVIFEEGKGRYRWADHMTRATILQRYGHNQCVQDLLSGDFDIESGRF